MSKDKNIKDKIKEKYTQMIREITEALDSETFTARDAFPYLLTRMARYELEIETIIDTIKNLKHERLLTETFLSNKGRHGNS